MAIVATIAIVIQVLSAIGVIVLVLLQQGKGADMGAAFGSGNSGSLFGATGSANFLSRLTAALATVFFASTLALAFVAHGRTTVKEPASVMDKLGSPAGAPAGAAGAPDPSNAAGAASGAGAATGAAAIPGAAPGTVPAAPGSATPTAAGAASQKNEGSSGIPK